jgi:hypothetical protein
MRQLVIATLIFLAVLALSSIPQSYAHDHSRPDLDNWFRSLQAGRGPCCDGSEALRLDDVDWDTKDGHYRVRIDGEWIDVPDITVVTGPNRSGPTMVWPYQTRELDGTSKTLIRCFLPGSMT